MANETNKEDKYSFENIRKLIYEIGEKQKESSAEFEKWKKESSAEFEKRMQESDAEFKKWQQWSQKNIAGISDSNGDAAEEAIYNALEQDKKFAGIEFDDMRKNIQIQTEKLETVTELDILMLNGDTVAIIETKYKVEKKDVNNILYNKLKYFRQYYPHYSKHKVVLGVGGMSFDEKALETAEQNGIGIIKIFGNKVEYDTKKITIY